MKNRLELPAHLIQRGLTGEGVEVGVLFGEYAESLLTNWPGKLHLVDPWVNQAPKDYLDGCNAVDMDEAMREAKMRMEPFGDRYNFLRMYSVDAAEAFADGSLDFVYLDGNHSEASVRADIAAWWPKIKEGGILCGHDFYDNHSKYQECGVETAVRAFIAESGKTLRVTPECTSWWIDKADPVGMVAVLGVSHVDFDSACRMLQWTSHLERQDGADQLQGKLFVACTKRIGPAMMDTLRLMCPSATVFHIPDEHERGYPGSASHLFMRAMEYAEVNYPGSPVLWLEADAVPMLPDWMTEIEHEYRTCGKPFMGHLETAHYVPHMAGVAVYPPNWRELAPRLARPDLAPDVQPWARKGRGMGQPFDTYAAPEIFPQAAHATTIQQVWQARTTEPGFLNTLRPGVRLFHQCKTGHFIAALTKEYYAQPAEVVRETSSTPATQLSTLDEILESMRTEQLKEIGAVPNEFPHGPLRNYTDDQWLEEVRQVRVIVDARVKASAREIMNIETETGNGGVVGTYDRTLTIVDPEKANPNNAARAVAEEMVRSGVHPQGLHESEGFMDLHRNATVRITGEAVDPVDGERNAALASTMALPSGDELDTPEPTA